MRDLSMNPGTTAGRCCHAYSDCFGRFETAMSRDSPFFFDKFGDHRILATFPLKEGCVRFQMACGVGTAYASRHTKLWNHGRVPTGSLETTQLRCLSH